MNGYDAKRQREEILKRLENEQQMAQYRQNQQRANISPLSVINKANGLSKGLFNTGSKLQKAGNFLQTRSNPILNNIGGKIGSVGSNMQNLSLRPQISSMLSGAMAPTTASTGAIGNAIGTGTAALPSTIGATGIGAGAGALGGAGTAAGGSALTGAISSAAPAATSLASGTGAAGLGAAGIAGAASAALPVVGAALMAGQFIKGQLDKAQQKANAKAMQADANAINATMDKVNQQKQGVMNDLMQQSQQDAQAMTLPTQQDIQMPSSQLSQEIMKQAYPDYAAIEEGSPTGFATGVNTPDNIQTLQNKPSIPTQVDSSNVDFQPLPNIQVAEGADGSAVIPQVEDTKESIMDKIRGGLTNFKAGYDDNSLHGFSEGDMHNNLIAGNSQPVTPQDGVLTGGAAQTKKTIMNRLGEAVGTGRRLMANPWVQAGIAGGISKAAGGDIDDIAKAAYDYGTAKAKSDQYYKAINPDAKVMPVFNTFDANDYKAKAYNDFNQGRSIITRRQLIALQNPDKSSNEIDEMISSQGLDPNEIISIKAFDTVVKAQQKDKDIDIKKDKNTWQKDQGQQKINIQQQNANTNYARLGETKRANSARERNQDRNYNFKVEQAKNKAGAKAKKPANTSSMSNKPVQDGIIIVNPKTGQRMRSRNGKWEII